MPFLTVKKGAEELILRIFRGNQESRGSNPPDSGLPLKISMKQTTDFEKQKKPLPLDTLGVRPKISRL